MDRYAGAGCCLPRGRLQKAFRMQQFWPGYGGHCHVLSRIHGCQRRKAHCDQQSTSSPERWPIFKSLAFPVCKYLSEEMYLTFLKIPGICPDQEVPVPESTWLVNLKGQLIHGTYIIPGWPYTSLGYCVLSPYLTYSYVIDGTVWPYLHVGQSLWSRLDSLWLPALPAGPDPVPSSNNPPGVDGFLKHCFKPQTYIVRTAVNIICNSHKGGRHI